MPQCTSNSPCSERETWTRTFTLVSRRQRGQNWKTTAADEMTWAGLFEGMPVRVVSTVRLTFGNLAHFTVHSGARIGAHDWNLPGGHYVDLCVACVHALDDAQLLCLGQLAATEENRPIRVRRFGERLTAAVQIPAKPSAPGGI